MTRSGGPAIMGGAFTDPARARDAFDTLIDEEMHAARDFDVFFSSSNGEYRVVVAAKNRRAEAWAARVLRDLGADVQVEERAHPLFEIQGQSAHGGTPGDRRSPDERDLLNRWMTLASLLVEEGVVEPLELITLVLSSQGSAAAASGNDRRSRLRAADAELREVSSRLEASLRDKRPELFDRAGRLRNSEVTRRLTGLTGGKRHLSGDDLLALESVADEEAARSPSSAT